MDFDEFELNDDELESAMAAHERQLQEDEQPLSTDGADNCGDACKI